MGILGKVRCRMSQAVMNQRRKLKGLQTAREMEYLSPRAASVGDLENKVTRHCSGDFCVAEDKRGGF